MRRTRELREKRAADAWIEYCDVSGDAGLTVDRIEDDLQRELVLCVRPARPPAAARVHRQP